MAKPTTKSPQAAEEKKTRRKTVKPQVKVILSSEEIAPIFLGDVPGVEFPVIRLDGTTVPGIKFTFYKKLNAFVLIQPNA